VRVVVPMAGRGRRFAERGVGTPKPLVEVAGRPMVLWALDSLEGLRFSEIVFVVLAEHEERYGLSGLLTDWAGARPSAVVTVDDVTEGQLCTVLEARDRMDADDDVLVASCDTYVRSDLGVDVGAAGPAVRGLISTAPMPGDHWSFARTDETGRVVEVAEKVRISDEASTGLYWFAHGSEFLGAADAVVANGRRMGGEFYVIQVYEHYLREGLRVELSNAREVWDMGTPEGAAAFEQRIRERTGA